MPELPCQQKYEPAVPASERWTRRNVSPVLAISSALILFLLFLIPAKGQATNETVTDSKGRRIILKSDKTWEYEPEPSPTPPRSAGELLRPDSFAQIRQALVPISGYLKKSEFETSAQYISRIGRLAERTIVPATGKALTGTVFYLTDGWTYKAEDREFYIDPGITGLSNRDMHLVGDFLGSYWGELYSPKFVRFPMEPDKARETKPNLVLAVSGIPVGVDLRNRIEIWVKQLTAMNRETGEIYAAVSIGEKSRNRP